MAIVTPPTPTPDQEFGERLDDLIPRSQPSWRRLAASGAIVATAIVITVLNFGGWIYPRPFDALSWGSGGWLEAHPDRGLVAAEVMFPNRSSRDIRVTSVDLDAPGARLAQVQLYLADETPLSSGRAEAIESFEVGEPVEIDEEPITDSTNPATPVGAGSRSLVDLPAVIPAGRSGHLVVWFEPIDCVGTPGPWGVAVATVDFGAGSFPPLSRTLRLDDDPVVESGEPVTVLVDGEMFTGPTALAAACEALR